jgi:hypothetical protein
VEVFNRLSFSSNVYEHERLTPPTDHPGLCVDAPASHTFKAIRFPALQVLLSNSVIPSYVSPSFSLRCSYQAKPAALVFSLIPVTTSSFLKCGRSKFPRTTPLSNRLPAGTDASSALYPTNNSTPYRHRRFTTAAFNPSHEAS